MGKVFLVASGKGGTGKTMFSVNFAGTLAKKGYKVLVVDTDLGMRNLDLYLGLEGKVVFDIFDVLSGMCKIKQAIIKDKRFDNLYIMAASPMRSDGSITPLHMKVLCDKLKEVYDYIIIDAPSGIDDGFIVSTAGVDEAIIVTTPDYSSLRDADSLDRALVSLGISKRWLVINKVIPSMMTAGYVPKLEDIMNMFKCVLAGVIQQDENIQISTNLGIPIVLKGDNYIGENFDKIGKRIIDK